MLYWDFAVPGKTSSHNFSVLILAYKPDSKHWTLTSPISATLFLYSDNKLNFKLKIQLLCLKFKFYRCNLTDTIITGFCWHIILKIEVILIKTKMTTKWNNLFCSESQLSTMWFRFCSLFLSAFFCVLISTFLCSDQHPLCSYQHHLCFYQHPVCSNHHSKKPSTNRQTNHQTDWWQDGQTSFLQPLETNESIDRWTDGWTCGKSGRTNNFQDRRDWTDWQTDTQHPAGP